MAEDEQLQTSPSTQDVAVHVQDYSRFTQMMKRGAIAAFIVAMIVLIFVL